MLLQLLCVPVAVPPPCARVALASMLRVCVPLPPRLWVTAAVPVTGVPVARVEAEGLAGAVTLAVEVPLVVPVAPRAGLAVPLLLVQAVSVPP